LFSGSGTVSALDTSRIIDGRDVGSANAFSPVLDDENFTFTAQGKGLFKGAETGSLWNILGQAVSGSLNGKTLTPLTAINHFWFDWVAFKPNTRIYWP
jgi:hypothetical protein